MKTRADSFHELVRLRQAIRQFQDKSVPTELIEAVLQDAQHSPSNCNIQPWHVHVVSGKKRNELAAALAEAHQRGETSSDFYFDMAAYPDPYAQRNLDHSKARYDAMGFARENADHRAANHHLNLSFFGAPHVALLFMPQLGDGVRVAGDLGMYGQTFLLSLAARGLGGIPQTMLGMYADTVRSVLNIDPSYKMLFGISFGYPDESAAANNYRVGRAPLGDSVILHA